ncbi:unnamed protein product [Parajaminaea phylloscopi]
MLTLMSRMLCLLLAHSLLLVAVVGAQESDVFDCDVTTPCLVIGGDLKAEGNAASRGFTRDGKVALLANRDTLYHVYGCGKGSSGTFEWKWSSKQLVLAGYGAMRFQETDAYTDPTGPGRSGQATVHLDDSTDRVTFFCKRN